jgi:hypothetical protein
MRHPTLALLALSLAVATACGGSEIGSEPGAEADSPVLQIRSEGGFTTPENNLGRGPTYTLLADGRLVFEGPVILVYPGPLLPNYQETQLTDDEVDELTGLVEAIGLPGMVSETDDSAAAQIADATTEVVTFWDENGKHEYSVYGLGIEPDPAKAATAATLDLVEALSTMGFSGEARPYEPDRVRVIAGVSQTAPDPAFEDVRAWPIDGEDPTEWSELSLGFTCTVLGPETLELFADATQATQWLHPTETMDAPPFNLLVRPLQPGEPDCPELG